MWPEIDNKLYQRFIFPDFSKAFSFMTRVAMATWKNTYNEVEIWLSTHDAGDIVTDKDRKLAAIIDKLTG